MPTLCALVQRRCRYRELRHRRGDCQEALALLRVWMDGTTMPIGKAICHLGDGIEPERLTDKALADAIRRSMARHEFTP